jgi:hypothetical protein
MNKNILLMLMMFALISCYSGPEQVAEPGVFKAPILKMKVVTGDQQQTKHLK